MFTITLDPIISGVESTRGFQTGNVVEINMDENCYVETIYKDLVPASSAFRQHTQKCLPGNEGFGAVAFRHFYLY